MEKEKIVKVEVSLDRIFFPKFQKRIESGEFGIFVARVEKVLPDSYKYKLDWIKLKGTCCRIEYGTTYRVYCKLVDRHETYGDTYEIIYISKCLDISSKHKQKEYLRNVIREDLVDKLFEKYDDVIKLLDEEDIESLVQIKGIGVQVAKKLIDDYNESKDFSAIYLELGRMGMTSNLIKKLVDHYKSPDTVIDKVRNDPYDLVNVDGIGFKRADEIACQAGFSSEDPKRVKAFFTYHLNEQGELGRSYLYYDELMQALYDALGYVDENVVASAAQDMIQKEKIFVLDNGNVVASPKYYNLEKSIMEELMRLQMGRIEIVESDDEKSSQSKEDEDKPYIPKTFNTKNVLKKIREVEIEQKFDFTEEQRNAILLSSQNNVIVITGGAGVGKSSTAKGICHLYKNGIIKACALSGKASVRITEATGYPAATIHRTLGYINGMFAYNKTEQLPLDVLLVDEATMINGSLFLSLLQATPTGAKVILMGDVQQLTPIGNCQVFADILNSGILPIARLTKPHRQALRSGIIPTSMKISAQEQIFDSKFTGNEILGELQDMELDIFNEKTGLSEFIIKKYQEQYVKYKDLLEVQVCVPMRIRGDISCYNLNTKIQELVNPKLADGYEIKILVERKGKEKKEYTIRKNDKVINTKNNYNVLDEDGMKVPVFNGNMGIVQDIYEDGSCLIDFIGIGRLLFSKKDCKNLELGYACTIHKMQGSGFKSVIVGMDSSSFIMNNSELLYTAVTRAKEYCILAGVNSSIRKAIRTKEVNNKRTFLKDMLVEHKEQFSVHEYEGNIA